MIIKNFVNFIIDLCVGCLVVFFIVFSDYTIDTTLTLYVLCLLAFFNHGLIAIIILLIAAVAKLMNKKGYKK